MLCSHVLKYGNSWFLRMGISCKSIFCRLSLLHRLQPCGRRNRRNREEEGKKRQKQQKQIVVCEFVHSSSVHTRIRLENRVSRLKISVIPTVSFYSFITFMVVVSHKKSTNCKKNPLMSFLVKILMYRKI